MLDGTGNTYLETDHARITLVTHRPSKGADWTGAPTIRLQARRGRALHMGVEVPLLELPDLMRAMTALVLSPKE